MDLVLLFICPAWVLNHYSFNRTAMLAVFLQLLVLLWLALGLSAGALLSASLTRSVTLSFWWSAAPVLFGVWAFLVLMATAAVFRFKWKQRQLDGEDCFDCFGSLWKILRSLRRFLANARNFASVKIVSSM